MLCIVLTWLQSNSVLFLSSLSTFNENSFPLRQSGLLGICDSHIKMCFITDELYPNLYIELWLFASIDALLYKAS